MRSYLSLTVGVYRTLGLVGAIIVLGVWVQPMAQTSSAPSIACGTLMSASLPDTTISSAQSVAAGAFTPPQERGGAAAPPWTDLPAFCRVSATTRILNSDVKFEVWMPAQGWNGDFQPA